MSIVFGSDEARAVIDKDKDKAFDLKYSEQEMIDLFAGIRIETKNFAGDTAVFEGGDYHLNSHDGIYSDVAAIANIIQQLPKLLNGKSISDNR